MPWGFRDRNSDFDVVGSSDTNCFEKWDRGLKLASDVDWELWERLEHKPDMPLATQAIEKAVVLHSQPAGAGVQLPH